MPKSYSRDFKKMIVELINIQGHSTLKTAEEFNIPLKTLETAFKVRGNPKNVIIHSDKGSQYRSKIFRETIIKHHCLFSYTSLNHSCDENANQESFHASLKKEWLYQFNIHSLDEAQRVVFEYIEGFYNNQRIHSSLGFLSPVSFENNYYFQPPC